MPRPCHSAPKSANSWEPSSSTQRGLHRGTVPAWCLGPAGVLEQGIGTSGFPRNLGDPTASGSTTSGVGLPHRKAPGRTAGVASWRSKHRRTVRSPPGEGNEVWRDGRPGVGAPHSSREAGEPGRPGAGGAKGVPVRGPGGGRQGGYIETRFPVHATPPDSGSVCESAGRRAGCLNWARPDLREPREATPGATRQGGQKMTSHKQSVPGSGT